MSRLRRFMIPGTCLALLIGCASPASRFYTLSAASPPTAAASELSIAVGPVSVPAALDRPEIVVAISPNRVQIQEFDRWASPLQDEISRAVVANLAALLETPQVTQSPQTLAGNAAYHVRIEVQQMESVPGQSATLDAVWTLRRPRDDQTRSGRTTVRETVERPGYDALAAAHSRAVARLSRDIADALRALAGHGG